MATQMSRCGSTNSSCKERLSFSTLPSALPTSVGPPGNPSAKDEIRDVQVDKGTTNSRPSKKRGTKKMKNIVNVEDVPSSWNANEASKNISRYVYSFLNRRSTPYEPRIQFLVTKFGSKAEFLKFISNPAS